MVPFDGPGGMANPFARSPVNLIEGLWKWMREDVTQMYCYPKMRALFDACISFIDRINQNPLEMVDRLWPRFKLDPEQEKIRFSE